MIDTLALILGAVLAAVTAYFVGGRMGEHRGRSKEQAERMQNNAKAMQSGRDAVRDGRASGDGPDDRLRRNDQHW